MSWRLLDLGDDEHRLELGDGAWPTVCGLLRRAANLGLAEQVQLEQGAPLEVNERQARALARHLVAEVLPAMGPHDWLDDEGVVHREPDDVSLQRLVATRRPHARRETLAQFAAFCARCAGFLLS